MTFIRPVIPASSDPVPDGSVTNAKVAATAAISADKLVDGATNKMFTANERTKLTSGVIGTAVGNVISMTGDHAQWLRVNVTNIANSSTTLWADRLAFYFDNDEDGVAETRTGYHNEYGELRARPAKSTTIAFRALGHTTAGNADIFQVSNWDQTTVYFRVHATQGVVSTVPITAPNIGSKVTVSATAPSSPAEGDVWIDTST